MNRQAFALLGAASAALILAACSDSSVSSDIAQSTPGQGPSHVQPAPPGPFPNFDVDPPGEPVRKPVGGPIDGLTPEELAAFERGKLVFERRFKPSEGLGPMYNATSCASCHSKPVTGGAADLYRNFYVAMRGSTSQIPLAGLISLVVPSFGAGQTFTLEGGRIVIPDSIGPVPVARAQRNSIPMFGSGMFEFISNATIIANSDPNNTVTPGDTISGRYNTDVAGLGRFGTKAQANSIEIFTRTPMNTQMGITSEPFNADVISMACSPVAQAGGDPNDPTFDADGIPDPEISRQDLGDLIAFTRFLAPPERVQPMTPQAIIGERTFERLGCVLCHIPSLESSRGPVKAYTDLLIHDMGPDLADGLNIGTPQTSSISNGLTGSEWRTQPLWGVSLVGPWLHDGRAETLFEAIEMHGGEAQSIRDAFMALSTEEQDQVIEFLEHL